MVGCNGMPIATDLCLRGCLGPQLTSTTPQLNNHNVHFSLYRHAFIENDVLKDLKNGNIYQVFIMDKS